MRESNQLPDDETRLVATPAAGVAPSAGYSAAPALEDLFDEALALDTEARELFLRNLETRDPGRGRELRNLIAILPDAESREVADHAEHRAEHGAEHRAEHGGNSDGEHGSDIDQARDPFVFEPAIGENIGGCILESVIGRGGVGIVYAAVQLDPPRPVAVKILRLLGSRASHLRRFRIEARALARLVHPALARIYATGAALRAGAEIPYIVMERIDGARNFVEWARGSDVASTNQPKDIARQLAEICDGLQHCHNRGVIHRDLKPSNLLVGADGHPHIIDFGVARLASLDASDHGETLMGAIIGTPAYMAPEQFELPPNEVDARVDIHALGVVLYESLVGRRPYEIPRHLYFDAAQIMRLSNPANPHLIDSNIPRDLAAIVMKAMAKDRDRRYLSATALADDLRAFVDGRSVRARAESSPERLIRSMRRNPAWTTTIVVSLLALATATVVSLNTLARARADRDRARVNLATIDAERGQLSYESGRLLDLETIDSPLVSGMLRRMIDNSIAPSVQLTVGNLMGGAMSPDGRRWLAVSDGGEFGLVDFTTGKCMRPQLMGVANCFAAGFSFDGQRIFAGARSNELVELFVDRAAVPIAQVGGMIRAILPAADNDRLLLVSANSLSVLRLSTGVQQSLYIGAGNELGSGAWNGAGIAYIVQGDRSVGAFEIPDDGPPKRLAGFHFATNSARTVAVAPDGQRIAIGSSFGGVAIADARTGAVEHRTHVRHEVWSMAFSRDGLLLHVGERSGRVHNFEVATGQFRALHSISSGEPVWGLGEAANGTIAANIGNCMAFFSASLAWDTEPESFGVEPRALSLLEGRTVRAVGADGRVSDLDLGRGTWAPVAHGQLGELQAAALSGDGRMVASLNRATLAFTDLTTGKRVEVAVPDASQGKFSCVGWNADATMLALLGGDSARVYLRDGTLAAEVRIEGLTYPELAWYAPNRFSVLSCPILRIDCVVHDGVIDTAASPIMSGVDLIYSGDRWILLRFNGALAVAHSGAASKLGIALKDSEFLLERHRDVANAASVSPDGTLLASGGMDGTVRLWSLATGDAVCNFSSHTQPVFEVLWLPDGKGFVSLGTSGEVRLHDSVARAQRIEADRASASGHE
jgi:serine/threonine protein kinase/WD40 repeat protein